MINVFAVFTEKLLQTLQNSSFHKTCYLEVKKKVFTILQRHYNFNFFQNLVMINNLAVFTGQLLQTLQNSSFHKTCYFDAKTSVLHNFALAL